MHQTRSRPAAILLLLAAFVSPLRAQHDPPVGPPAPGKATSLSPMNPSPAAMRAVLRHRLDQVLEVLSGDFERLDSISFTENFVARTPRAEALQSLRDKANPGTGFEVLESRFTGDATIAAWARSKARRSSFITIRLSVEPTKPHRIDRLDIAPAQAPRGGADTAQAWREFDESLAGRPFRTGMAAIEVSPDGSRRVIHSVFPDERLGIGTMGTLFAHLALAELIDEGGAAWDKPLSIDESLRSLPDSRTSHIPGGTELPLSEYAHRAMLEGDNTCADHLIAHLGRERIEMARDQVRSAAATGAAIEPAMGGEPFLTTIENYRLKCGVSTLITRYADASNDERRRLLETEVPAAEIDLTLLKLWQKPQELTRVGWSASPRELCEAGARLLALSKKPGNDWSLGALRPLGNRLLPGDGGVHSPVILSAGEPGARAGLWIIERPDGQAFIMAIVFNIEKRPLPEQETATIISHAVENLSMTP